MALLIGRPGPSANAYRTEASPNEEQPLIDTVMQREAPADAPEPPAATGIVAHPLVALAMRLVSLGEAGVDGDVTLDDGVLRAQRLTMATRKGAIVIDGGTATRVRMPGRWPDTVAGAMNGRRMTDVVGLPTCGDADVDDAIGRMTIAGGETGANGDLWLTLEDASDVAFHMAADHHG